MRFQVYNRFYKLILFPSYVSKLTFTTRKQNELGNTIINLETSLLTRF